VVLWPGGQGIVPFSSGRKETVSKPINFGRIMKTMPLNVKRQKGFYVYGKFSPVLLFFRKILSGC
jgi:hypothetical protein